MTDIDLPLGHPRSGRARYAAAMTLYNAGHLSPTALEAYRICALLDAADPARLFPTAHESQPMTPTETIRALIDQTDRYLASLPGPGVAEVRHGLNHWRGGPVTPHPSTNPVLDRYLPAALAQLTPAHPDLAHAIAVAAPFLNWITYDGYPPADIGAAFATGHCYATLMGAGAAVSATDYDLGIFLIAPHVLYRDHNHAAPELYAPLTGPHGWRFGPGDPLIIKPAHAPVWNDAFRPHMTKVGPTPFLALFGWTRDVQPLAQVIPAPDWPALEALRLSPDA